ncbi:MAG: hypothetical protein ABSF84_03470 [Acidimicrobiales bacterium]|jgi:polyisoprenoid-binding protein YceI
MTDQSNSRSDLPSLLGGGASTRTLDPAASGAGFHVEHLWGLMTVDGHFDELAGDGGVGPEGAASGEIRIAAGRSAAETGTATSTCVRPTPSTRSTTWGPLGTTSPQARAVVTARFVRR